MHSVHLGMLSTLYCFEKLWWRLPSCSAQLYSSWSLSFKYGTGVAPSPLPRGRGWEASSNYRGPAIRRCGGVGPDCVACVFCLSRQQQYLSTVQTSPFRPNPSHSATDMTEHVLFLSFRFFTRQYKFRAKIFIRFALVGGGGLKHFSPGLEPALGRLAHRKFECPTCCDYQL